MNHKTIFLLALFAMPCGAEEDFPACLAETDDAIRLACYDDLSKRSALVIKRQNNAETQPISSMSRIWELEEGDKRGAFVVKTHQPNFLLPLHLTSAINRSPTSPTHPVSADHPNYKEIEAKLQISLRAKVAENLLLPGADLWFAYTQRSLWQLWDQDDSAPFRSTDYQPEAIYVIPVPAKYGALPFGWHLRMLQLGAAHQSNGQSEPLSRSWNRVYFGAGFERNDLSLLFRANQRLKVQSVDDNPDLVAYIGRGEVHAAWTPGVSNMALTWRTTLNSLDRGSLQFDWSYPVFAGQPNGLRWYAQLFSGYGETLLDYNHRQTSLGLGLSLFQF